MTGATRAAAGLAILALLGGGSFLLVTAPQRLPAEFVADLADADPDPERGRDVFLAAGCAACHAAPDTSGADTLVLAGGQRFVTDFGTFLAPNISPDPEHGIGRWQLMDFARAVTRGVSPDGRHYYPALPYTSYIRMTAPDVAGLWAYIGTLPASSAASQPHEAGFPFSWRRLIGGWKRLYLDEDWVTDATEGSQVEEGRYLVEALGHCGECHTPRTLLGGLDRSRWLAGAPNPDGKGRSPDITPGRLTWDTDEIAYYLETGFTPEYDSAGGHMAKVVGNFTQLPAAERSAVAAYLKALPAASP